MSCPSAVDLVARGGQKIRFGVGRRLGRLLGHDQIGRALGDGLLKTRQVIGQGGVADPNLVQHAVEAADQLGHLVVGHHLGALAVVLGLADLTHRRGQGLDRSGDASRLARPGDAEARDCGDHRGGEADQQALAHSPSLPAHLAQYDHPADAAPPRLERSARMCSNCARPHQRPEGWTVARPVDPRIGVQPRARAGLGEQGAVRGLDPRIADFRHHRDRPDRRKRLGPDQRGRSLRPTV